MKYYVHDGVNAGPSADLNDKIKTPSGKIPAVKIGRLLFLGLGVLFGFARYEFMVPYFEMRKSLRTYIGFKTMLLNAQEGGELSLTEMKELEAALIDDEMASRADKIKKELEKSRV